MNLPVRLRREAQREYDEATDWYESRRTGLGVRFVTALQWTLQTIEEQPDRYPEVWPGGPRSHRIGLAVLRVLSSTGRLCDGSRRIPQRERPVRVARARLIARESGNWKSRYDFLT